MNNQAHIDKNSLIELAKLSKVSNLSPQAISLYVEQLQECDTTSNFLSGLKNAKEYKNITSWLKSDETIFYHFKYYFFKEIINDLNDEREYTEEEKLSTVTDEQVYYWAEYYLSESSFYNFYIECLVPTNKADKAFGISIDNDFCIVSK